MSFPAKLTTVAACRAANIDRQRFNEYVSAGDFPCAPNTIPGRARLFSEGSLLTLFLFKRLMDDGLSPRVAGHIACTVGAEAHNHPECPAIAYVEFMIGSAYAVPADNVPAPADWPNILLSGRTIKKVTTFNIAHLRALVRYGIDEERSIIGPDDPES